MNKRLFPILIFFAFSLGIPLNASNNSINPKKKAVTYYLTGRLGNELLTYLVAKWVADKNGLPLLYQSFPNSENFAFHYNEKNYLSDWESKFKKIIVIREELDIESIPNSSIILINLYKTINDNPNFYKFKHNLLNEKQFRLFARELLQPAYNFQTVEIPKDKLSILAHVRTGGDFDEREMQLKFPKKFPPHNFYINSIAKLSEIFNHVPIYVYIMTDDLNPQKILNYYKKELSHLDNLEFDCRKENIGDESSVMEDFFTIPKFDCLIRGTSTFSIAAAYLTDFKAVVTPSQCYVENGQVVADTITIELRNK